MPSLLSRLFGAGAPSRAPLANTKASRTGALIAMHALGRPRWTSRAGDELTRQGYERNAVVYRCVRLIAENAASVPWLVYENGEDDDAHPLARLLARPNPNEPGPMRRQCSAAALQGTKRCITYSKSFLAACR